MRRNYTILKDVIQFIINEKEVSTNLSPGLTLLDFIRYNRHLTGTKIGCREGDCGACTVLVGEIQNGVLTYHSVTSCLMPIANANGKHIVTIEGINGKELNPMQQAMSDEGATQCGFCTPGFVMSLTGFCLQNKSNDVIASIDGNICRCTGYKSIERAAHLVSSRLAARGETDPVDFAVEQHLVPEYFSGIKNRLLSLKTVVNKSNDHSDTGDIAGYFVSGGTDLYVQKHEEMVHANSRYMSGTMKGIRFEGMDCIIGASVTVTDMLESGIIRELFPHFPRYAKLVSSTPIRNMATLGGNLINASPIGDFTVFFLALDAVIILTDGRSNREVRLREFYKGYKILDKASNEIVKEIRFSIPGKTAVFNFEKVSKRTNLDIASVNSAVCIVLRNGAPDISVSAGGVGPVPMYLKKTSEFLTGNTITNDSVLMACKIAGDEISPISDVRGSAAYKRLLLQQLIRAHFIALFPDSIEPEKLLRLEEY